MTGAGGPLLAIGTGAADDGDGRCRFAGPVSVVYGGRLADVVGAQPSVQELDAVHRLDTRAGAQFQHIDPARGRPRCRVRGRDPDQRGGGHLGKDRGRLLLVAGCRQGDDARLALLGELDVVVDVGFEVGRMVAHHHHDVAFGDSTGGVEHVQASDLSIDHRSRDAGPTAGEVGGRTHPDLVVVDAEIGGDERWRRFGRGGGRRRWRRAGRRRCRLERRRRGRRTVTGGGGLGIRSRAGQEHRGQRHEERSDAHGL